MQKFRAISFAIAMIAAILFALHFVLGAQVTTTRVVIYLIVSFGIGLYKVESDNRYFRRIRSHYMPTIQREYSTDLVKYTFLIIPMMIMAGFLESLRKVLELYTQRVEAEATNPGKWMID